MLWLALHFPALQPAALETLAGWACQFTPRVSLEPPRALLAEVEGSLRLFGGLDALVETIESGLRELNEDFQLAVDATPRAALWRARGGGKALETLPLSATGWEPTFFESVGVRTVGELLALPRDGLARRCPAYVLEELDRARGALPEPRRYFAAPPRFRAEVELPAPVSDAEALVFAARRLLVQLEGLLAARHDGLRAFCLELLHSRKRVTRVEIGLASLARDAGRFCSLLRERLGALQLSDPVEAIRVSAQDFEPLAARSAGLFGDRAAEEEGWAQLLERLRARLGHDAVHGVATHPDHRPEYAWRRIEPGDWDAHEPRIPGPRPAWLLEPRPIAEASLELLAGPERIEAGWWDGDDARRDYFVARRADGSLAWIYREGDEWFVHGLFA